MKNEEVIKWQLDYPATISIIGGLPTDLKIVDKRILQFIDEQDTWLFYVLTGSEKSLAAQWADYRGVPIRIVNSEKLWEDCQLMFFIYRGEQAIKNAIMRAQNSERIHGSMITL